MTNEDEAYEAFLAREEADDWRERSIEEGRQIGELNGEINELNECIARATALIKEWRENAESLGDRSPWTATTYGQCAFRLEQALAMTATRRRVEKPPAGERKA